MRTSRGVERLYVVAMALSLAGLALAAGGCGEATEERQGEIFETPAQDALVSGRSVQSTQAPAIQAMGVFQVQALSGPGGDAHAQRVGIGGGGPSTCRFRAGSIDWLNSNGTQTHQTFFVYDLSAQAGTIEPVSVSPGQWLKVVLWTNNNGATANAQIVNLTTGQSWSGSKNKPANCSFFGEQASWIVERPIVSGIQRAMANFGLDAFSEAWMWDANGQKWGLGVQPTTVITMVNGPTTLVTPNAYIGDATHSQWSQTWNARL